MNAVDVTAEGTGSNADYTVPVEVKGTFAAQVTYQSLQFTIIPDDLIENTEKFTITLQNNVRGEIKEPNMATVYILDDTCRCFFPF